MKSCNCNNDLPVIVYVGWVVCAFGFLGFLVTITQKFGASDLATWVLGL